MKIYTKTIFIKHLAKKQRKNGLKTTFFQDVFFLPFPLLQGIGTHLRVLQGKALERSCVPSISLLISLFDAKYFSTKRAFSRIPFFFLTISGFCESNLAGNFTILQIIQLSLHHQ